MIASELIEREGKKYFFKQDGKMAKREKIIDPKTNKIYQADKHGVCREQINGIVTVRLKDSQNFVRITDGIRDYYGGNQAWYDWGDDKKNKLSRSGACGTVASANIAAYLAGHCIKYASLYAYPDYKKTNFTLHMKEMYAYIAPYHIGKIPLGIWPISRLARGVARFSKERNVELKAVWRLKPFNLENITEYIIKGLEKDSPVAMLVGTNEFADVAVNYFSGSISLETIGMHWVTITELKIDENRHTTKVKVSTWGGWAELDIKEYLRETVYEGLVYFE